MHTTRTNDLLGIAEAVGVLETSYTRTDQIMDHVMIAVMAGIMIVMIACLSIIAFEMWTST